MKSWARLSGTLAHRLRARLHLNLLRQRYDRALGQLPAIAGPAIVVGSAPNPHAPKGLTKDWFVVTVNGSQVTAEQFGLSQPNLTVFRDGVELSRDINSAMWAAVDGKRTDHLVAIMSNSENHGIAKVLPAHNYGAAQVTELSRHVRGAVIVEMSGQDHVGLSKGVSNGVFAALLALKLGAAPVVMSGFSFGAGWHFAKDVNVPRGHIEADKAVCAATAARGHPIFAADPEFAKASGLPLWTGS